MAAGDGVTTTATEPHEHGDPRIGGVDTYTWRAIPAPTAPDLERLGGYCVAAGDYVDEGEADVWIEVTAEHPKEVAEFIVQAVTNEHASLTQAFPKASDYDLRDDLQSLTSTQSGVVWIKDVFAHVEPELVKLRRERDLAIAHDRQPYPTAWAYTQACKALEHHRQRANEAEDERDQLKCGGKELGKTVVFLADLIKDAYLRGANDPIDALYMLGNYLADVFEGEGGLPVDEFNRVYRALEDRRKTEADVAALREENARLRQQANASKVSEDILQANIDALVAERDV